MVLSVELWEQMAPFHVWFSHKAAIYGLSTSPLFFQALIKGLCHECEALEFILEVESRFDAYVHCKVQF